MHTNFKIKKAIIIALAVMGSSYSMHSKALTMGDIAVKSALGQPLSAQIKLQGVDNKMDDTCFTASSDDPDNQVFTKYAFGSGSEGYLTIKSAHPIVEPATSLTVFNRCQTPTKRNYTFIVDAQNLSANNNEPKSEPAKKLDDKFHYQHTFNKLTKTLDQEDKSKNSPDAIIYEPRNTGKTSPSNVMAQSATISRPSADDSQLSVLELAKQSGANNKKATTEANTTDESANAPEETSNAKTITKSSDDKAKLSISKGSASTEHDNNTKQLKLDSATNNQNTNAKATDNEALTDEITTMHNQLEELQLQIKSLYDINSTLEKLFKQISVQLTQVKKENDFLRTLALCLGGALLLSGYFFADWLRRKKQRPQLDADQPLWSAPKVATPIANTTPTGFDFAPAANHAQQSVATQSASKEHFSTQFTHQVQATPAQNITTQSESGIVEPSHSAADKPSSNPFDFIPLNQGSLNQFKGLDLDDLDDTKEIPTLNTPVGNTHTANNVQNPLADAQPLGWNLEADPLAINTPAPPAKATASPFNETSPFKQFEIERAPVHATPTQSTNAPVVNPTVVTAPPAPQIRTAPQITIAPNIATPVAVAPPVVTAPIITAPVAQAQTVQATVTEPVTPTFTITRSATPANVTVQATAPTAAIVSANPVVTTAPAAAVATQVQTTTAQSALVQSNEPANQVNTGIMEDVDVFLTHGRTNLAIQLLQNHLIENPKESAVIWIFLLDLLAKEGKRREYEITANECKKHFNIKLSDYSKPAAGNDTLESFERISAALQKVWGTPLVLSFIDELIYNTRLVPRIGFDREIFEELMLLREVAEAELRMPKNVSKMPNATIPVTSKPLVSDEFKQMAKEFGAQNQDKNSFNQHVSKFEFDLENLNPRQ